MKQMIPMDKYGVFADSQDVARADSRFVAEAFEKNHRDVLRSIRAQTGLRLRNFAQSTYIGRPPAQRG